MILPHLQDVIVDLLRRELDKINSFVELQWEAPFWRGWKGSVQKGSSSHLHVGIHVCNQFVSFNSLF